jgi:hypothetical protein
MADMKKVYDDLIIINLYDLLHRPYLKKKDDKGGGRWSKIADFETTQFMNDPYLISKQHNL